MVRAMQNGGGYYHLYSCNDPKQVKKEMESCIGEWYKEMKKTIKNFEKELFNY